MLSLNENLSTSQSELTCTFEHVSRDIDKTKIWIWPYILNRTIRINENHQAWFVENSAVNGCYDWHHGVAKVLFCTHFVN